MAEFNLIDESWIPCIDPQGNRIEYGIKDTLFNAHKLREICDDSPLVTVAIHRLLLAILYRAYKGPQNMSDWEQLWRKGFFERHKSLDDYFDRWHDRFYLFHDTYPFMQVAGLDLNEYDKHGNIKKDKTDGLMRLASEAPDKSGRILFDHRMGTERPEYEPSQIARMLLATHSYASTGVASKGRIGAHPIAPSRCKFAPCLQGLVLWLQAENLFQSLLLNLVPYEVKQDDLPAWEDNNNGIVSAAEESWKRPVRFSGVVQRYAPLSRFILCLDRKSMFFTNGLKAKDDEHDPMMAYRRESQKNTYQAVKLQVDKAAWRDVHTFLDKFSTTSKTPDCINFFFRLSQRRILPSHFCPRANVAGIIPDQGKLLLWRHERLPVPADLLANKELIERLGSTILWAENAAKELGNRTGRIAKLYLSPTCEDAAGRQPETSAVKKVLKSIDPQPAFWARLEQHFYKLLEGLPDDWDQQNSCWKPPAEQTAVNTWRAQVKREAQRALEESIRSLGTTGRAIQSIARVCIYFTDDDLEPAASPKRRAKSKGGKKR